MLELPLTLVCRNLEQSQKSVFALIRDYIAVRFDVNKTIWFGLDSAYEVTSTTIISS